MPIYEYQCLACGHKFDLFHSAQDEALKKCPECGKDKLNKLISAPAFQLKGEGWYVTDFKDKTKKKDTAQETKTKQDVDSKESKDKN